MMLTPVLGSDASDKVKNRAKCQDVNGLRDVYSATVGIISADSKPEFR